MASDLGWKKLWTRDTTSYDMPAMKSIELAQTLKIKLDKNKPKCAIRVIIYKLIFHFPHGSIQ